MKIGTKSILFGAHCFFVHPLFVLWAWCKLYGFPWDIRILTAIFVHDFGYWGKPNMEGDEGEKHPVVGAAIMHALFDHDRIVDSQFVRWSEAEQMIRDGWTIHPYEDTNNVLGLVWLAKVEPQTEWRDFALYHSRYYAHKNGKHYSRLCVADKLAFVLTWDWFYLICVNISGEIHEFMKGEGARTPGHNMTQRQWLAAAKGYCRAWVKEHSDLRPDKWTGENREKAAVHQ